MAGKSSVSTVRALLGDFLRYSGARAYVGLALALLGSAVEAIGLIWLVAVLRLVLKPDGAVALPAPMRLVASVGGGTDERVALALGSFALLALLRATILSARDVYLARLQFDYVECAKAKLLTAVAAAPYGSISRVSQGYLTAAITGDVNDLGIAASNLIQCGVAGVALLGIGAVAVLLSPALALTAVLASATLFGALPLAGRAAELGLGLRQHRRRVAEQTLRLLYGLKPAKAQAIDAPLVAQLKDESASVVETQLAFLRLQSLTRNVWALLAALVGILCAAGGLIVWRIDAPVVIAFLLLSSRMTGPAVAFHQALHQVFECASSFDHLRELGVSLVDAPSIECREVAVPGPIAAGLSVRDVRYLHRGGEGVCDISIDIPRSAFWGISGISGSGKTTFVDLVAGLLDPQAGTISVDGVPLTGAVLDRHRASLAYVSQDAVLFGETVRDGLRLADPGSDEERIAAALNLVGADDLIRRVPDALDLPLLNRDAFMSSGERQRLAIACALLRRPTLLILDEATNALDIASEAQILHALAALSRRPTILLIAHRPHALAHCQRVLRFGNGRLKDIADALPAEAQRSRAHAH
jgi:ATP-binding cassette subfamily C protein